MRATPVRLILALVPLLVAGCSANRSQDTGGAVPPPPTTIQLSEGVVVVQNLSFNPQRIQTPVGREVVWRFSDNGLAHTVTADDKSFDSGRKASGSWPHTFAKAGTFAYHCEVHAKMHGTVVVSG